MREGAPAPRPATPMEQGSLEGNVKMPLTYFAITLHGLGEVLASEDPKAEVAKFLDPIPLDERLEARTRKANAQHAHHDIGRILKPEEVRRIEIAGVLSTLRLLSTILEPRLVVDLSGGSYRNTLPDGSWSSKNEREALAALADLMTPERAAFIGRLVAAANTALRSPEIVAKLRERKALLKGWEHLSLEGRETQNQKSILIAREVKDKVKAAVDAARNREAETEEQKQLAERFLDSFGSVI